MKIKILLLFLAWLCYSCDVSPKIDLPVGLRNQLFRNNNYFEYVHLLNTAYTTTSPDDVANFLRIGNFDSKFRASEHGEIIFKLIEVKGDSLFYLSLKSLDKVDLQKTESCLSLYFEYSNPEQKIKYFNQYPRSFDYMGWELPISDSEAK